MLRERYEHAVANFTSLDQDEAIDLFTSVIEFLESQAERRALQHQELVMLGSSHFYRAAAKLNLGTGDDEVREDLRLSLEAVTDSRDLEIDLDLVSPKLIELFNEVKEGQIAHLLVIPDPAAADVTIDGRPALLSIDGIPVLPGTHTVTARHPGSNPAEETVTVVAGETVDVYLTLESRVETYRKIDFFVTENDEQQKKDARVEIDFGRGMVTFCDENGGTSRATFARIAADAITSMSYRESDSPLVPNNVPGVSLNISGLQGMLRRQAHWLTVEFLDEDGLADFVYMRLDNDNFREILAALESCSGKTVDGAEEL
jgi:hypothetical protein